MKKFTKLASLLTAAALLAFLPDTNALTASAEGAKTYAICYLEDEEEWCFQEVTDSDEDDFDDVEKLEECIKDGDSLVVYGSSKHSGTFKAPARLNTLTILGGREALIVYTNGIQEAHVTQGAIAAINGNVEKGYVYDDSRANFNNNVAYLEIDTDEEAVVACLGTVGHAVCRNDDEIEFVIYNVATDKFRVDEGELETDEEYYSTTPVNAPAQPTQPAAPQTNTSASNEYDDVPKTGESFTVYLFLAAAAICFAGSRALKKA